METIVKSIVSELKQAAEPKYKKAQRWFFKEPMDLYGVRVGEVRKITNRMYKKIEPKTKKQVFALCEELLEFDKQETRIVAFQWASKIRKEWKESDFKTFEKWLKTNVSNWASCDDLCTGALGEFLLVFPTYISKTHAWRTSKNRWIRRGSAVSLILPVKKDGQLEEVFACAETLLMDPDDMVQKGYGWMLKEASNVFPQEVFEFVMKHKKEMPRTSLRYAIEKLPKDKKKLAMEK